MKTIVHFTIFLLSLTTMAQKANLFDSATEAYNAGEYQKAVDNYLKIVDTGQHSSELYFNMGNAYYKMNEVAPSIYYYEKALLLKPNDSEIENNLGYAQKMTLDAIEQMPKTGLSKIYDDTIGFLSFDQWSYVAVVFMLIFVLCYIAFYYFQYATYKRISFIVSIVSLFISLIAVVFAYLEYSAFEADRPAIVFSQESSVKSEPNAKSQEAFGLHEGTKVNVLDHLNQYAKIRIADGTIGWIPSEDLKLLKDF